MRPSDRSKFGSDHLKIHPRFKLLDFCSDKNGIKNFGSKLNAWNAGLKIETKTWLGKIENICTICDVKMKKMYGFHTFVQD